MWNNKKAVSPLIAAVLLIVVTVGIGAVVTGIVRNYVTENKQTVTEKASDMKCGIEVSLNVPVVADAMRICKNTTANPNIVRVTLENTGSTTVDELQMKVFGAGGFVSTDEVFANTSSPYANTGMPAGATATFNITYVNTTTGALQEVKLIPRVKVVGRSDKAYCTDAGLTFADINECT